MQRLLVAFLLDLVGKTKKLVGGGASGIKHSRPVCRSPLERRGEAVRICSGSSSRQRWLRQESPRELLALAGRLTSQITHNLKGAANDLLTIYAQ